MIGYLQGQVLHANNEKVIILTNSGIGYEVHISFSLYENKIMPIADQSVSEIKCFVSTIQRESSVDLYGFKNFLEKYTFELLLMVSGVGPKLAFTIVKSLGFRELRMALISENLKTLTNISGIGTKTAKQIILDLKTKMEKIDLSTLKSSDIEKKEVDLLGQAIDVKQAAMDLLSINDQKLSHEIENEVLEALKNLGFKDGDILKKMSLIKNIETLNSKQIIMEILKYN